MRLPPGFSLVPRSGTALIVATIPSRLLPRMEFLRRIGLAVSEIKRPSVFWVMLLLSNKGVELPPIATPKPVS